MADPDTPASQSRSQRCQGWGRGFESLRPLQTSSKEIRALREAAPRFSCLHFRGPKNVSTMYAAQRKLGAIWACSGVALRLIPRLFGWRPPPPCRLSGTPRSAPADDRPSLRVCRHSPGERTGRVPYPIAASSFDLNCSAMMRSSSWSRGATKSRKAPSFRGCCWCAACTSCTGNGGGAQSAIIGTSVPSRTLAAA